MSSSAFPPTEPGVTELKTLPAGLLVRSETKGDYFEQSGVLFRPLFRYIKRKDIAMTTPVEAQVGDTSAMYFWIGEAERSKAETDLPPTAPPTDAVPPPDDSNQTATPEGVVVLTRPERLVISHGGRGGYSRDHFDAALTTVQVWLANRPDLEAVGEPSAIYWSGPFMPGFLKRYEVHLPVRRVSP